LGSILDDESTRALRGLEHRLEVCDHPAKVSRHYGKRVAVARRCKRVRIEIEAIGR
jgi:hypothetical protein